MQQLRSGLPGWHQVKWPALLLALVNHQVCVGNLSLSPECTVHYIDITEFDDLSLADAVDLALLKWAAGILLMMTCAHCLQSAWASHVIIIDLSLQEHPSPSTYKPAPRLAMTRLPYKHILIVSNIHLACMYWLCGWIASQNWVQI